MRTRRKTQRKWSHFGHDGFLSRFTFDHVQLRIGYFRRSTKLNGRARPEYFGAGLTSNGGHIEGMIEMGMADDDGIGAWYVLRDSRKIRREAAENALAQGCSRYVGIKQYDVIVATNLEACRSEPANSNAGIFVGDECVTGEFQVFWMHHDAYSRFFFTCLEA
jgi:hypothetical protein